jgi:CheY-like chemotaxis protein
MSLEKITARLHETESAIVKAVFVKAARLLDNSPRFKLFTLHGEAHLAGLFRILEIFLEAGFKLTDRELYLLSLAICTHDLGMVVALSDKDLTEIAQGRGGIPDPVNFENFVRDVHHKLIGHYFKHDLNFLTSLGVTIPDLGIIADIGEGHRKILLRERKGLPQQLGALLRVIDELDVGPSRAPADIFENIHPEMDAVSKYHWFKHNITEDWDFGHNVILHNSHKPHTLTFSIVVRPTREQNIGYWITQVARPIQKALKDDDAQSILFEHWGIKVQIERDASRSRSSRLGDMWSSIEENVLTQGRKVILVVDDEIKKIEDTFFLLMEEYHVKCVPYPKAALQYCETTPIAVAIIDLQMDGQDLWSESDTQSYTMTGFKLAGDIRKLYPKTKICILTGTRHEVSDEQRNSVDLFIKKPIFPVDLQREIKELIDL